jgi:HK97 family phage major capsid protein
MQELRTRLVEEMIRHNEDLKGVLKAAQDEKRDLTGEEQQRLTEGNQQIDEIEERVRELDKRIVSDKHIDELRAKNEHLFRPAGDGREQEQDSLEQRVVAWARGEGESGIDIPFRGLRVVRDERTGRNMAVESRTGLNELTAAAGDATVPTSFRAVLYQHLILNSAVRQTRATVLPTDSGEPLLVPKTTAHPAAGTIVAEAAVINENDPTFGQGTLNAYKYPNLIQVSNELITDTGVDLLGYLAVAMGRALGLGAGHDYILGTGTSQPEGIIVGAGTVAQTLGGTGQSGVPTYAELEKVYDSIIPPYQVNAEWLFSQKTVAALRQLTDLYGRPLWTPSLVSAFPNELFGKPYYVDPYMPNAGTSGTSIAFGDMSTYFIRDVGGVRFERSNDYAFNTDLVTFRAIIRTDGRLIDKTGAIGVYKGGTA